MVNSKKEKERKSADNTIKKTPPAEPNPSIKITSRDVTSSSVRPDDVERRDGPGGE